MERLIELKEISVSYDGVKALNKVNVWFDEGEIVALMGPNGAGKSTILKALFGLVPIEAGKVSWHGHEITPVSYEMVERGIAFVPQGRRVFSRLTVKDNLEIGGYVIKDNKQIKGRMSEVLDIFPALKQKLNSKSGSLSGGQQQMLAIARGLMVDPRVLLLDEPSLGLAPKIVSEVFDKIKEINERRKTTMVVVEHNIKSLLNIANRAYILDKGQIISENTASELMNSTILEEVFLGANIS